MSVSLVDAMRSCLVAVAHPGLALLPVAWCVVSLWRAVS